MEKKENSHEIPKPKEYGFEDGIERIIELADLLLRAQKYVVIGISEPLLDGTNVGKTFLSTNLAKEFIQKGVPCILTSDEESLKSHLSSEIGNGVVILGAMGSPSHYTEPEKVETYKTHEDLSLQKIADSIGLPLAKIDIHVFIYRPGKPIDEGDKMYNDVIIKNDQAVDK